MWFISHNILLFNNIIKKINLFQLIKGPLENDLQEYFACLPEIDLLTFIIELEEINSLLHKRLAFPT